MNAASQILARKSAMCLALMSALAGCSSQPPRAPTEAETVTGVSITTARKSAMPDTFEAMGTVRAVQTGQLASQMMGTIREIHVREGDRVEQGQLLATIDDAQPRAMVEQAVAAVSAAQKQVAAAAAAVGLGESTFKRYEALHAKQSVSAQEFEEVRARFQAAQAQHEAAQAGEAQAAAALARARDALEYAQVRAPFAGVIVERKADPGSLAAPGVPLFTLEGRTGYRLEAAVDEGSVRYVRAGQSVEVRIDSLDGAALKGRVAEIVPAADSSSRSFLVKIALPANARLRSGLFGRAPFSRGERSVLLIPREAVITRGQMQGVYVVGEGQIATLRYVTLGATTGASAEVFSGLEEGERLIAAPGQRELAGKRIVTANE